MKLRKIFSISLALALQVMPLTRLFVVATPAAGSSFAIIAMWLGGAAALMGSVDAVSGASSISISPATATTGVPYSGIVQYSGSHASSARSWQLTKNWLGNQTGCNTSYQIAPGLWLTNAGTYLVRVGGTPTASGTYNFTVKILDGANCIGGNSDIRSATITISGGTATAPSITTQPANQTVTAGGNASFAVVASGTAPLAYQWRQNGTNVGANSATLSLTSVTLGQAGSYLVVVSNSAGSVTSSPAILTVNPAPTGPSITTQPISQTVTAGGNTSFTVSATGTGPLSYQWRQNGTNTGASSSTLALTSVTVGQAGSYTVVVSNSVSSVTSSPAILTVNVAATVPSITTQPISQTVIVGSNANFAVVAGGTGPLGYQWRQDGTNLAGAGASTLALTGVTFGQAGGYTVVVTNSVGSVTSSVATLTVNSAPVVPSITAQPISQTVTAGTNVSFTILAGGTGPLGYQWRQNGTNVAGGGASTLALTGVTVGQAGNYTVVVTNIAGSVTSSVAILTVNVAPVAPGIVTQPLSQTAIVGGDANFIVLAAGTGPLSYQWQQDGTNVPGANTSALALTNVNFGQAGGYLVVITNSVGSVTSSVAILTVNPVPTYDITRPTIAITAPVAGLVQNSPVTILGTATDDVGVKTVWYSLNGGAFGNATGAADWSVWGTPWPVLLSPGTNVVRAYSEDLAGNVSLTNTVTLIYNTTDALELAVTGAGQVSGATNGQSIKLGRAMKLKALPASGNIFSNWVATVDGEMVFSSTAPTLTVNMLHHLKVTANFVPNPFPAVAGQFNGLFYETNGVKVATCGSFSLKLSGKGAYSAVILNDGRRTPLSGSFDASGKATNIVKRSGTNALKLTWSLDLTGSDQISGQVASYGSWISELTGDRAVFNAKTNPCPYAGKYTFVLPGTPEEKSKPEGNSYGTVSVDGNGLVKLTGFLADKSSITKSVPISRNGEWPIFIPLTARKGVLLAWINFANRPTDDFSGLGIWLMPPKEKSAYYPAGFADVQTLVGSHYTPPLSADGRVLELTNAIAMLSGGDLSGSYTNEVVFGPGSKVTAAYPNEFATVFTQSSGLLRGTFQPGATLGKVALKGVAFQKTTNAFGCFFGKSQSGGLVVEPGNLSGSLGAP